MSIVSSKQIPLHPVINYKAFPIPTQLEKKSRSASITVEISLSIVLSLGILFLSLGLFSNNLKSMAASIGINNLFNQHNIVGVTPASAASSLPAPGDQLALMAGRSVSVSMTFGYAPKR